jgi:hypothetical protein
VVDDWSVRRDATGDVAVDLTVEAVLAAESWARGRADELLGGVGTRA